MGTMLIVWMFLAVVKSDFNDVDSMDSSSDTSSTGGQQKDLDNNDPNLHNPLHGQGYGAEITNLRWDSGRG